MNEETQKWLLLAAAPKGSKEAERYPGMARIRAGTGALVATDGFRLHAVKVSDTIENARGEEKWAGHEPVVTAVAKEEGVSITVNHDYLRDAIACMEGSGRHGIVIRISRDSNGDGNLEVYCPPTEKWGDPNAVRHHYALISAMRPDNWIAWRPILSASEARQQLIKEIEATPDDKIFEMHAALVKANNE